MIVYDKSRIVDQFRPVLSKLGCRGPLNFTKSGTIVLTKCIISNFGQDKSVKVA